MTGNKYIGLNGIDLQEIATIQTSAGAGDAGKILALNSSGLIDSTALPSSSAVTMTASESISAGAIVNIWDSGGGVMKVRNADNSAVGKQADGFCIGAITSAATGPVNIGNGINTGVSGLTVGARYVLGSAGAVTVTAPTTSASILQKVGVARSATELEVIIEVPIIRA